MTNQAIRVLAIVVLSLLALASTYVSVSDKSALMEPAEVPAQEQASTEASSTEESHEVPTLTASVTKDADDGGAVLTAGTSDLRAAGFAAGDSVDVACDGDMILEGVPVLRAAFVNYGVVFLDLDGDAVCLHFRGERSLWSELGLSKGDEVTLTLHEEGAYATFQEMYEQGYSDERDDYASDEAFANFRRCAGGDLTEGLVYRSASPFNDKHGRSAVASKLAQKAGIAWVLDLADSRSEVRGFIAEGGSGDYAKGLYRAGKVTYGNMTPDYATKADVRKMARCLYQITQHRGPFLIHCTEGKDRTGLACILLESLAGASYEEVEADFLATFENYWGDTYADDERARTAVVEVRLRPLLEYMCDAEAGCDLAKLDLEAGARSYLAKGGLSKRQIDALQAALTK